MSFGAIFAILVQERDPVRLENLPGLLATWLQDAGGFTALGLAVILLAYGITQLAMPGTRSQISGWQVQLFLVSFASSFVCFLIGYGSHVGLLPDWQVIAARTPMEAQRSLEQVGLVLGVLGALAAIVQYFASRKPGRNWYGVPWHPVACGSAVAFGLVGFLGFGLLKAGLLSGVALVVGSALSGLRFSQVALTLGGLLALTGGCTPFLADMLKLRPRRIWALTLLTFKEAIRRRILWFFLALLLAFLFAGWFLPHKPEDQVRTYVRFVYWGMTPFLLVTAGLLAALSIPTDIKSQTLHTIVTKPVERFEIVLGRFLGNVLLMTVVMLILVLASVVYVTRGVEEEAAQESLKARVPVYGNLVFRSTKAEDFQGTSVGREWEYRKYITGGRESTERAVWEFREFPGYLDQRKTVPCEFSFDIFRTTKGEEGKGIFCSLQFVSWRCPEEQQNRARNERNQERSKGTNRSEAELDNLLAEKYGFHERPFVMISDYRTFSVDVPVGLFKHAMEGYRAHRHDLESAGRKPLPAVQVIVKCESDTQYLGVARYDLYLLDAEGSFFANFFKGAIGLWLRVCLVVGVAVACSTYLSGIISWLATLFLFSAALFRGHVEEIASKASFGGGPAEAFLRLVNRENPITPLAQTPAARAALYSDEVFSWFLKHVVLNILPDVDRLNWTAHVAEGFDVSGGEIALQLLILFTYLLPWGVLGYYLMKTREVAST